MQYNATANIFWTEDDVEDVFLLNLCLKDLERLNTCTFYQDGISLLNALNSQSHLPQLIVLDLNMPVLNGREVIKILKATDKLQSIPVIVYSTSSQQRDIDLCLQAGAIHYETKPSNYEGYLKMVRRIIDYAEVADLQEAVLTTK